ncbi:hypothetical protein PDE_06993 [Penicillium oxalicum 114-2]|uniref:Secreted protein n=1 Tax=Penicillium oxalicum (strain 114-2 / CGMCC 5302) TaxID=933388 RepID=S7ZNT1_PENO1|nr:hypothetical protein PDE_06993 [Penicillium oxalicum 114-2]
MTRATRASLVSAFCGLGAGLSYMRCGSFNGADRDWSMYSSRSQPTSRSQQELIDPTGKWCLRPTLFEGDHTPVLDLNPQFAAGSHARAPPFSTPLETHPAFCSKLTRVPLR